MSARQPTGHTVVGEEEVIGMSLARRWGVATTAGAVVGASVGAAAYAGLVTGAIPIDLGVGRRVRPLGPIEVQIGADRETVFGIIAAPYLGRPTRATQEKLRVVERGTDLVLAMHYTPTARGLVARTLETVRFERPERVSFRLVRGPVPYVVEEFLLVETSIGTQLTYRGELGTDLWALGERWGDVVARSWQAVVAGTFEAVKTEAERRHPSG